MKSMIKRIVIGVSIALILSFINSCDVHASVAPYFNNLYFPPNLRVYNLTSSNSYSSVNFNRFGMNTNNSLQFNYNAINWNGTFANYGYALGIQSDVAFVYGNNYSMTFYFGRNSNSMVNVSTSFTNYFTTHYGWGVGTQVEILNRIDNACIDLGQQYNSIFYGYRYLCSYSVAFKSKSNGYYLFTAFNSASKGSFTEEDFSFLGYSFNVLGDGQLDSNTIRSALSQDFNTVNTNILNAQNSINNNMNIMKNEIKQKQQETTDAVQEQTDFLKDTSTPNSGDIDNVLNTVNTNNANVSDLVNLIPSTLQVIINGFNQGCSGGYSLGSLFGTELVLPCINPVEFLGSFLWGIIDSILCLFYLIPFSKWLVNTYNDLTSLKNRRFQ